MKLILENWKRFLKEQEVKISYSAVVLIKDDVKRLKEKTLEKIGKLPEGFVFQTKKGDSLPHHMTITMGPLKGSFLSDYPVDGKPVTLTVTHIGFDDKAIAAKVDPPGPTNTKFPHITIAIPIGGQPANSNKIPQENFEEIDSFDIQGIVEEIPSKEAAQQPKKKKKQPQQKKGPNIPAMVQGMARSGEFSHEEIQTKVEKATGNAISIGDIVDMIGSQK